MDLTNPAVFKQMIEEIRNMAEVDPSLKPSIDGADIPVGSVVNDTIQTKNRKTPIRIFIPEGDGLFPAVIFFHGGGFILGSYDFDIPVCRQMCHDAKCVVFSVDYVLAPENPFPAAVNEVYEVSSYIKRNAAQYRIIPEQIAIGGSSAGGNLALVTAYQGKVNKELSFAHLILVYPPLNLLMDPKEKIKNLPPSILAPEITAVFDYAYLGDSRNAANPLASPELIEDLEGLPPTSIFSGGFDPLYAEQERLAKRLRDAGIETLHKFYPRIDHGFLEMQGREPIAKDCKEIICAQLRYAFFNSPEKY